MLHRSNGVASRERFVTTAVRRTRRAIESINAIGNLANQSYYRYDDADIDKIIKALTAQINVVKARLSSGSGPTFTLDGSDDR